MKNELSKRCESFLEEKRVLEQVLKESGRTILLEARKTHSLRQLSAVSELSSSYILRLSTGVYPMRPESFVRLFPAEYAGPVHGQKSP